MRDFTRGSTKHRYGYYDINEHISDQRVMNLGVKYEQNIPYGVYKKPMIHAQRFQTGK